MQILDGKVERNELNETAKGGSEAMVDGLLSRVDKDLFEGTQIVVSRLREPLRDDRVRIFWAHDLPGDPESSKLLGERNDKGEGIGHKQFDKFVFVSHWQKQQYVTFYSIPHEKCVVLQNAIDPSPRDVLKNKPTDTIDIIYHTTPHRGLDVAYAAINEIMKKHEELRFHVYSSFKIYGWEERDKEYESLFDAIKKHPQMEYHGTVGNEEVRKAVDAAHIFGYPSIWPETSCMALMEAMSAGCICLHSDLAALPETSANWTYMYGVTESRNHHADLFASCMDQAVAMIKRKPDDLETRLNGMKSYCDLFYNWELRKVQWEQFLMAVKNIKPKAYTKSESYEAEEFVYRT